MSQPMKQCDRTFHGLGTNNETLCDCPTCPCHTQAPVEDWEKEFDGMFCRLDKSPEKRGFMDGWFLKEGTTGRMVKNFIRSRLSHQRASIREMVPKFHKSICANGHKVFTNGCMDCSWIAGYRYALNSVNDILSRLDKE